MTTFLGYLATLRCGENVRNFFVEDTAASVAGQLTHREINVVKVLS
jgi:hypothetical protein